MNRKLNRLFKLSICTISFVFSCGYETITLENNSIDEFTGDAIKQTSWFTLGMTAFSEQYCRFSKVNDREFMEIKCLGSSVGSVNKGEKTLVKFEDGQIVEIHNLEFAIMSVGQGSIGLVGSNALGIHLVFRIDEQMANKLKTQAVTKIRVYSNDGYYEIEPNDEYRGYIRTAAALL